MQATGYCECGCGQLAPIAKVNNRRRGFIKGEPMRFVHGHNGSPAVQIGERFGMLLVLRLEGRGGGYRMFAALCDCGKETAVRAGALVYGTARSCGCQVGYHKHGQSYSRTYSSWKSMIQRCTNPNAISWKYYGARGIAVCDHWRVFANFYADMGDRPEGMSLDRIDNDGDYEAGNCRWSTVIEQRHNRRPRRKRH